MLFWFLFLIVCTNAALLHNLASPGMGKKFGQMMAVKGNRLIAADDDTLWAYKWGFNKWEYTGLVGSGHLGEIKEIIMGDNTTAYIVYQQNVTHGVISMYNLVNDEWLGFGELPIPDTHFGRAVTYYDGELAILGNSTMYKFDTNFTITSSSMDECVETLAKVSTVDYMGGCPGVGIVLNSDVPDTAAPHDMIIQMEDYLGGLPGVINGVALNSTGGSISVVMGGLGLVYALTSSELVNERIYSGVGFYDTSDGSFRVLVGFMNESSTGGVQVLRFNGNSSTWSELYRFTDQTSSASFYGMNAGYSELGLYVTTAHRMGANDGAIYTYSSSDYQLRMTDGPTVSPTTVPTTTPTTVPTTTPTMSPSNSPSSSPTVTPSDTPTVTPSNSPSSSPTVSPSASPTATEGTIAPTDAPTGSPSAAPTMTPTEDESDGLPTVVIITLGVAGIGVLVGLVYMCCGTSRVKIAVSQGGASVYDF